MITWVAGWQQPSAGASSQLDWSQIKPASARQQQPATHPPISLTFSHVGFRHLVFSLAVFLEKHLPGLSLNCSLTSLPPLSFHLLASALFARHLCHTRLKSAAGWQPVDGRIFWNHHSCNLREMTTDIPSVLQNEVQISVHLFSQFTEYRLCHCGRVMLYGVDVGGGEVEGLRGCVGLW